MAKSPDAFRTISEVAAQLDTPAHVLRFWESKFPQVKPVKRAGGRRYYRPDDIALLAGIKVLLHDQGMTIRGVQKLLRERGVRHVATLSALPWEGVEPTDEAALDEAPAGEAAAEQEPPEAVVVGPWPGAGDAGAEAMDAPAAVSEEPAAVPAATRTTLVEGFVAGVAARLATPGTGSDAEARPSLARLRGVLSEADGDRLRADAARLRPLVERLRGLRGGSPGRTA